MGTYSRVPLQITTASYALLGLGRKLAQEQGEKIKAQGGSPFPKQEKSSRANRVEEQWVQVGARARCRYER